MKWKSHRAHATLVAHCQQTQLYTRFRIMDVMNILKAQQTPVDATTQKLRFNMQIR